MKFFDLDGPVYRIGTEIADFMILTLYWVICCMPIITIGASTTSMFYVYGKKVRGEDAYVTRDFFKSFRENFKQSIPITILLLIIWMSSFLYLISLFAYKGQGELFVRIGLCFLLLEVSLVSIYVFAILARFHMKTSQVFLTAFVLANKHPLTSLMMLTAFVAGGMLFMMIPATIFMIPAMVVWVLSISIQKIFSKNIKQTDEQEHTEDTSEVIEEIQMDEEAELSQETSLEDASGNDEDDDKDFLKYI